MRIVHICNSLLGGGIQNFLLSLLPEQVAQGHDVTLVVIDKYSSDYCEHLENILTKNGVKVSKLNKLISNKNSLIKTLFKCRRLVKSLAPDVVNTHGVMSHTFGAFATIFTKIKQVLTVHNAPELWPMDTRLLCSDKPLIFCSKAAYDMRKQESKLMAAIDNGISRNIVHSDQKVDLRRELGLNNEDKIIVSVGSLRPQKNYEFIKQIIDVSKDPSLHFCICGGNYGSGYVSMDVFKDYPQIHCLGLRSDVSAIENGADLFLSCAAFEGLPIAVLEAYFNGIPCVLSPIPQHKNISDVENVYLPPSFDAKDFVQTIRKALAETEDHDIIYEKRKSQIAQYSISEAACKYIEFYQKNLGA